MTHWYDSETNQNSIVLTVAKEQYGILNKQTTK